MKIVTGVLFSFRGTLAVTSLSSLPVFLLANYVSQVPPDAWLGVYVAFTLCAHFLSYWVGVLVSVIASKT